jgi:HEAT repeat protein
MTFRRGFRSRGWLIVVATVGVLGLILWMASGRLPTYQGKGVYHWMLQTQSSSLADNPGLAAIGTNAVPYLARALAAPQTQFDRHAWVRSRWAQRVLGSVPLGHRWTHPAAEVRQAAAYSLLTFQHDARPALPELLSALNDPSLEDGTRQLVLWVLGKLGPPDEALTAIIRAWEMASNASPGTRQSELRRDLLVNINRLAPRHPEQCLSILLAELNSGDAELQGVAAWGIGSLGHMANAAAPTLQHLIGSTNDYLRFAAAAAIGRVTNSLPAALPALRELAQGTNARCAAASAVTLWRWGEPPNASVGVLTNLLADKEVKGIAAGYLGVMGRDALPAVPALIGASQQDIGAWVDRYDRAKCALAAIQIDGINEIAAREVEAALAFKQNSWVRGAVARDLAQLGSEAARFIPALQRNLQDDDRSARHEASEALARIEGMFHAKP